MHKIKNRKFFSVLFSLISILVSCESTSNIESKKENSEEVVEFIVPVKKSKSYFSSINEDIISLVEDGSPASLRKAVSMLHKASSEDYTEKEKVLLNVCSEMMKFLWPSENFIWDIPVSDVPNSYIGAIESSRRGIYDLSTGNSDFLTIALPSLVLLTSTNKTDFYEASNQSLMSALALNPDSLFVNFLMGVLEYKKSDYKKALHYFEICKLKCPENFEILFSYVHTLYVLNDYNQALSITEALLEKYPQNVDLLELCAKITFSQNNLEKAESYVVKVLLMEPENLEYVLLRARILIKKMDYIRASALLDVYGRLNDSSKEYLILRAQLQKDWNKNNSAAVDICTKALMYYPDDFDVLLFSASLASETNSQINGMDAISLVNRVLKMSPNNMTAIKISIVEMMKLGMWTEAYTLSKNLLKDDKDTKMNYFNHIDICLALKKNSEAYDLAYKLYQEDSSSEDIQQSYIKVLVANGQRGAALQLINSLMQNANSKMKSFLYYQKSFFSVSETDILSDLRSSLTANPRNRDSLYRLYEIYYKKSDWKRAQYYLKQVVALDPNNREILKKNSELDSLQGK